MADYLSFAGGITISDPVSSDSEEELNVSGLNLDEEEPEVRFNNSSVESEDLAVAPISNPEASRKRPRDDDDDAQDEEELIEGNGLFAKRPPISGCPDMKEWLMKSLPAFRIRPSGITVLSLYIFLRMCRGGRSMAKMTCQMLSWGIFWRLIFLSFSYCLLCRSSSC